MEQGFEERYLEVLQDIETAILEVYRKEPSLLDSQVDAALEALAIRYDALSKGREPRPVSLDGGRLHILAAAGAVCEARLGRSGAPPAVVNRPEEIAACLKRIRKSVRRITKERGRQGYLEFIAGFL